MPEIILAINVVHVTDSDANECDGRNERQEVTPPTIQLGEVAKVQNGDEEQESEMEFKHTKVLNVHDGEIDEDGDDRHGEYKSATNVPWVPV